MVPRSADVLLEVNQLSKYYGNLKALEEISFSIHRHEVVGVVGRRGSGKTTLMSILGGITQLTEGEFLLEGKKVEYSSPQDVRKMGIELVHQVPQVVDAMDVVQNIFLGHEINKFGSLGMPDYEQMSERAAELISSFDLPASLINVSMTDLTFEQRHLITLMRAFSQPFKLLLLDDILPNLTYHRQIILLDYIRRNSNHGAGIIICSNNLNHLFTITDRLIVLVDGRIVANLATTECTPRDIVEISVGTSNPEQITPVIWALENYQKAEQKTEELFQKHIEMYESLEASDQLNRQLVVRLRKQVMAMNRLNSALQEAQRRLMTEREEERKALARDLHDSVIQDLLGMNYRLEDLEHPNQEHVQHSELGDIRSQIRQVVSDLRQVCRDLRPPTIDNHGLSSAIPSLVQEWEERTGISVKVDIAPKFGRLPEWIELSIFRIIQEGLSNVAKHAEASVVKIELGQTSGGRLIIRIMDNGRGIEHTPNLAHLSANKHFGLVGISERVALLDGTMKMASSPDGGFSLEVVLPNPDPFTREYKLQYEKEMRA